MKLFGVDVDNRRIAFLLIFSALALVLFQFNFSTIIGAEPSKNFTFFQFIGPMAGGILGPVGGVASVLIVSLSNFVLNGEMISLPVVISFFTMAFAAMYFGTKRNFIAVIPLLCIALFWIHPIGDQVRFFALFWVIPVLATFVRNNIFARSLGATFTAHAIGGVAYLYAFNVPAEVWAGLVPIVIFERLLFAAGITVSYYAVNTMLQAFAHKIDFSFLNIEKKYALLRA
jgi:hypothetical protein